MDAFEKYKNQLLSVLPSNLCLTFVVHHPPPDVLLLFKMWHISLLATCWKHAFEWFNFLNCPNHPPPPWRRLSTERNNASSRKITFDGWGWKKGRKSRCRYLGDGWEKSLWNWTFAVTWRELFASKKMKLCSGMFSLFRINSGENLLKNVYLRSKRLFNDKSTLRRDVLRPELILSCEPFRVRVNKFPMILFQGEKFAFLFIENSSLQEIPRSTNNRKIGFFRGEEKHLEDVRDIEIEKHLIRSRKFTFLRWLKGWEWNKSFNRSRNQFGA